MTDADTPTLENGLPPRVESLKAVLYTIDEVRALFPDPGEEKFSQPCPTCGQRRPAAARSNLWITRKLRAVGVVPRFLGDQRLWLKDEVEAALPKLVRVAWEATPKRPRTA